MEHRREIQQLKEKVKILQMFVILHNLALIAVGIASAISLIWG